MIKTIGNQEYDFNVKLGTTLKIKKAFNKNFNQVLANIEDYDAEDLIKLLYCGINEQEVSKEEFKNAVLENCGLMELYELVQSFIKGIQYPGLSEEEIDKKIVEKNKQAQALGMTGLSK